LLYIDTPTHIRYERIRERWDKLWESRMSYEQFLWDENLESEKENSIIQELADIVIENSGSQKELFGKIDFFIANQK
jgi:dephospho-CoA kinase